MVENVFGILVSRFRVLLDPMGQRSTVVRDIVFTCVMLNNMLRTHQGRADKASSQEMMWHPGRINMLCVYQMRTTEILRGRPNINKNY